MELDKSWEDKADSIHTGSDKYPYLEGASDFQQRALEALADYIQSKYVNHSISDHKALTEAIEIIKNLEAE